MKMDPLAVPVNRHRVIGGSITKVVWVSLMRMRGNALACTYLYKYKYNFVRGCTKYKRRAQVDTNEARRSALAAAVRKSSGIFH